MSGTIDKSLPSFITMGSYMIYSNITTHLCELQMYASLIENMAASKLELQSALCIWELSHHQQDLPVACVLRAYKNKS